MRNASELAYIIANGGLIQVNASEYSTDDLLHVALQSRIGGGKLIIIDDGTKSMEEMVLLATNGASIIDTGLRRPEESSLIAANARVSIER